MHPVAPKALDSDPPAPPTLCVSLPTKPHLMQPQKTDEILSTINSDDYAHRRMPRRELPTLILSQLCSTPSIHISENCCGAQDLHAKITTSMLEYPVSTTICSCGSISMQIQLSHDDNDGLDKDSDEREQGDSPVVQIYAVE